MEERKFEALLLDIIYEDNEEFSMIKVFVNEKGKSYWLTDNTFHPYLYITGSVDIEKLKKKKFGEDGYNILEIKKTKKEAFGNIAYQIYFKKVSQLIEAKKDFNEMGVQKYEYNIPFSKRYLIDKNLAPGGMVEISSKNNEIISIKNSEKEKTVKYNMGAFDLETQLGERFEIGKEPILMASIATEKKSWAYSYDTKKVKGLEIVENEERVLDKLNKDINEMDFIVTYNGDNFDFPYVKKRAEKFKKEFLINGKNIRIKRHGMDNAVELKGKQHIDAYQIMRFMQRTGSVNIVKLDLENVSEKVFGIKKEKLNPLQISNYWQGTKKELERLVDYNLKDSETTLRIAKDFLPLFVEISKLTSETLSESTRRTTSQMVEDLLLKEVHKRGIIAPNKPHEGEIRERMERQLKGAFVKEPMAGLHENIVVLDFASLYPSIITSHNISPEKLNCEHKECKKNISPDGTWFCTREKGLVPEILEKMLKQRLKLKKEYKKKKKEGVDDKILFAKQWALKIILNSTFGYLGYPRARWYSFDSASAILSWARKYIHETIAKAEKEGFKVLYSDTDSLFLITKEKKKDIEEFIEKINDSLPEDMELELDGFYKRGIFVTKKEGGAAKKRYALIDESDNLKIVGFEYVRRDWCKLAKETQRKVIELVLKEGKPDKAAEYVRGIIKELNEGKVKKEELTIITLLKRKVEDYDSIGPHVAAAKKAIARGKDIGVGSLLSFIITKGNGKNIGDKAELEEFVEEGNYDSEYYIENQILPAVIKIIRELGYSREDLIQGGKQSGLGAWS